MLDNRCGVLAGLSVHDVDAMSDEQVEAALRQIRWPDTGGEPRCPTCEGSVYTYQSRPIFKCRECLKQFSLTSGTLWARRKMPLRNYLLAMVIFRQRMRGVTSMEMAMDLAVNYRTGWRLNERLRRQWTAGIEGANV